MRFPRNGRGHVGRTEFGGSTLYREGSLGALRVVLGLFTLLVVTLPAFAQQDRLTGTWRFRTDAGILGRGSICAGGNVSFNNTGVVTGGHLNECDPRIATTSVSGGRVTVDANGNLAGTVGTVGLQGNFLPAGDAFVAHPQPVEPDRLRLRRLRQGHGAAFSQNDLIGTWRVMLLQGGELPNRVSENGFGAVVVTAGGVVTGGAISMFSHALGATLTTIREREPAPRCRGPRRRHPTPRTAGPFPAR